MRPDRCRDGPGARPRRVLTKRLPAGPRAPAVAREAISEWLGPSVRLDDVLLATSELVTNAARHGVLEGGEIELTAGIANGLLRVSVSQYDGPTRLPTATAMLPSATDERGRGLAIVSAVSDEWGVDRHGNMTVWFKIALGNRT